MQRVLAYLWASPTPRRKPAQALSRPPESAFDGYRTKTRRINDARGAPIFKRPGSGATPTPRITVQVNRYSLGEARQHAAASIFDRIDALV
jgi:hypothetical protein